MIKAQLGDPGLKQYIAERGAVLSITVQDFLEG